jgi:hypothetical protein
MTACWLTLKAILPDGTVRQVGTPQPAQATMRGVHKVDVYATFPCLPDYTGPAQYFVGLCEDKRAKPTYTQPAGEYDTAPNDTITAKMHLHITAVDGAPVATTAH